MAKFFLTQKALEDLSTIWDYTFNKWSESQADKYYSILVETCKQLAGNPEMGKKYNEVEKGILGYNINKHIIIYQAINNKEIEVIRILHSSMDLAKRMED